MSADAGLPLISILIPAYNHAAFVEQCIRSVFEQAHRPLELVIVDDCSTDDTWARIQSTVRDAPIVCKTLRNDKNQGICRTLNRALAEARGHYVSVIASDDALAPNKLSIQLAALRAHPEFAACQSDMLLIDREGAPIRHFSCRPTGAELDYVQVLRMADNAFVQACLFRTAEVRELGGFDETLRFEDWDFMLRFLQRHRVGYAPGETVLLRYLENSLGKRLGSFEADYWRIVAKHEDDPRVRRFGLRKIRSRVSGRLAAQQYFEGNRARARVLAAQSVLLDPGNLEAYRPLALSSIPLPLLGAIKNLRARLAPHQKVSS